MFLKIYLETLPLFHILILFYKTHSFPLISPFVCDAFIRLGESIAANNAYRQQESEHVSKRGHLQASMTSVNSVKSSNVCHTNDGDAATFNIQDLIHKLQTGLEVSAFNTNMKTFLS